MWVTMMGTNLTNKGKIWIELVKRIGFYEGQDSLKGRWRGGVGGKLEGGVGDEREGVGEKEVGNIKMKGEIDAIRWEMGD